MLFWNIFENSKKIEIILISTPGSQDLIHGEKKTEINSTLLPRHALSGQLFFVNVY
jgi:hypothetical protein